MQILTLFQAKGGVGKSHIARMIANYAMEKDKVAYFVDIDADSSSLSHFFTGIKAVKPETVKFTTYDLLKSNGGFDNTKFDNFLEYITSIPTNQVDFVVIDMGARCSTEFNNYLKSRPNLAADLAKDYGFRFLPLIAGSNMYTECVQFVKSFPIDLAASCELVCNAYFGYIEDKSIRFVFPAPSFDSSALEEFKERLKEGFTPEILKDKTSMFRYRAFQQYCNECNAAIEQILANPKVGEKKKAAK